MIPILYPSSYKDLVEFNNNGLGFLTEATKVQVSEDLNGKFDVYIEYPISGRLFRDIASDTFVKVKPNSTDEPHIFRIYETEIQTERGIALIEGTSITFDLVGNMVMDVKVSNATPSDAWRALESGAVDPIKHRFNSDITTRSNGEWIRTNLLYCISGEEGSMLQKWGGEIKRENFQISLFRRRGRDNVTTIRHGKNMKGFTATYSTKGIVTAIVPVTTIYNEDSTEPIELVGDIVYSPIANKYPIHYYNEVIFTEEDGVVDMASLNAKAARFFTERPNHDKPSINVVIDMIDLSDSPEFYKFKDFENVEIGDTVTVYSKQFDMNLTSKVISIVYNALLEINESIELGTSRASTYEYYKQISRDNVANAIKPIDERINLVQIAANGKNRVFRGVTEPTTGMAKNDIWYKPVGAGETMMYVFDGAYWQLNKVSAGLLGGTLDAENGDVNLINVNVANIVGEISEFIKSYWNAINGQITIDGAKFEGRDLDGNRSVINTSGQFRSESGTDGRYGIFEKGRIWFYNEDSSAVLNIGAHPVTGEAGFLKGVLATARAQRLILGRYNDYLTTNINATVNPYISFEYGSTVGDEGNVYIKNWKDVSMSGKHINDVQRIEGYELAVRSTQGRLRLGAPQADGTRYNTLEIGAANTISNGSIDMKGYNITNQSDIRLKTNVEDSKVNALREVERMRFIEYDWDLENPANNKKPTGRQFGIVAQYSPFLQTKASGSESYLSVDMSKQVNLNSKAIQELKKENDTLKQELADLKAVLSEKGLI